MKLIILTESLAGGGSERRACTLASRFKDKGHQVKIISFYPHDHHSELLVKANVEHRCLGSSKIRRIFRLRNFLKQESPHAVLAFGTSCSLSAKLASLPSRTWDLIVCEAQTALPKENRKIHWDRKSHFLADFIITNSHTNRLMINYFYPHVSERITTIYNPVDINIFHKRIGFKNHSLLNFVIASRLDPNKNAMRLIEAINLIKANHILSGMEFHWYGYANKDSTYFRDCKKFIESKKLQHVISFHEPVKDIGEIYRKADAVVLPSLREGLPNSVCEALACGLPVIMSSVCDAGNLVRDGYNGFLFNPNSLVSMAKAIQEFKELSQLERDKMGRRSREFAENWLDSDIIADKYLEIIKAVIEQNPHKVNDWPAVVPQTSLEFLKSVIQ
jgi:glycosyltransferase involved in cell wall biosynthesis